MEQKNNYLTEVLIDFGFKVQHKTAPFMTLRKGRNYDAMMHMSILTVFCQRGSEWEKLFEMPAYIGSSDEVKEEQIKLLKEALQK